MQKQSEYNSQLDGLRAVAIILVILFHWFPEGQGVNILANGPLGVTLFFVLSGFLITRILLSSRTHVQGYGLLPTYKTFMIRRILRIFPVYYLVLFGVWFAKYVRFLPEINSELYTYPGYYLLYLSNFLIEKHHNWADVLSPFWSLAVEEQFYILWPLIILTLPQRYLRNVIILTIFLGIVSRCMLGFYGYKDGVLMPTCLDAFGLGALWAFTLFYDKSALMFIRGLNIVALPAFVLFVFFCLHGEISIFYTMFFRTSMSLFCLYFVAHASYEGGFRSLFGVILNSGPLRYIGKISYGLYVYHMLVPAFFVPLLVKVLNRYFHVNLVLTTTPGRLLALVLLVVLASLSWYLFEAKFIRLKDYFKLRPVDQTTENTSG